MIEGEGEFSLKTRKETILLAGKITKDTQNEIIYP